MDLNQFLFLLGGLKWTLALSAIGFALGSVAGLGVALARPTGRRWRERGAAADIARVQGTPRSGLRSARSPALASHSRARQVIACLSAAPEATSLCSRARRC